MNRKLKHNILVLMIIFEFILGFGVGYLTRTIVTNLSHNEPSYDYTFHEEQVDIEYVSSRCPLTEPVHEPEMISLGEFKLTGYCSCEKCCGQWADGITATGTVATEGRTIAVDPKVIPLGTEVIINGNKYTAEDTGSAINQKRIDIYKDNHYDCFSEDCNGYAEVFIIVEG